MASPGQKQRLFPKMSRPGGGVGDCVSTREKSGQMLCGSVSATGSLP